jgi:Uma2 family endonuclease
MNNVPLWEVSPERFPRAPSEEVWSRMTSAERDACVAALPNEVTYDEMSPPEGDHHQGAKARAVQSLRRFFRKGGARGRSVYVGSEVPVYYPESPRFAPDLFVVFDVADHPRDKYVVSAEGRGLDFALEVHYGGDRKRDTVFKVALYAKVGIPEYFVYDRARQRLSGYRLPEGGGPYRPILAQAGLYESKVLGVSLGIERENVRFYLGEAPLPDDQEHLERMEEIIRQTGERVEAEAARAEAEAARAEAEAARAEAEAARAEAEAKARAEAEEKVRELQARLDRLGEKG